MARDHIRQFRKLRGLSQIGLGKKAKLTASEVSRIELGYRDFPRDEAVRVAKALGVSIEELLLGDRPPAVAVPAVVRESVSSPAPSPAVPVLITAPLVEPIQSDLSSPKTFNEVPDASFLKGERITESQRARIAAAVERAQKILHTSGVKAAVWRAWRDFERSARQALQGGNDGVSTAATIDKPQANEVTFVPRFPLDQGDLTDHAFREQLAEEVDRLARLKANVRFPPEEFAKLKAYRQQIHEQIRVTDSRLSGGKSPLNRKQSPAPVNPQKGYNALFLEIAERVIDRTTFVRIQRETAARVQADKSMGYLRHFRVLLEANVGVVTKTALDRINTDVLRTLGRWKRDEIAPYELGRVSNDGA